MDQLGLTHISFSVSDLTGVLKKVEEFGGAVVEGTVTEAMAMIRDPASRWNCFRTDGCRRYRRGHRSGFPRPGWVDLSDRLSSSG